MKDVKDLRTADLLLPPKLGRPISGNALSNAAKQKAYRDRKNGKSILLTDDESSLIYAALNHFAEFGKSKHSYQEIITLMCRFSRGV